jgi:hypothetical protein
LRRFDAERHFRNAQEEAKLDLKELNMAKANADTTSKKEPKTTKPAAKKAPAKKAAAPVAQSGVRQIDTNLAAQSAAAMLRNREMLGGASQQAGKTETSTFKNLKEQIAKPKSAALANIMGTGGEQKKGVSHFMNQQRGHNQTQGGFNKTGVPRRTNG